MCSPESLCRECLQKLTIRVIYVTCAIFAVPFVFFIPCCRTAEDVVGLLACCLVMAPLFAALLNPLVMPFVLQPGKSFKHFARSFKRSRILLLVLCSFAVLGAGSFLEDFENLKHYRIPVAVIAILIAALYAAAKCPGIYDESEVNVLDRRSGSEDGYAAKKPRSDEESKPTEPSEDEKSPLTDQKELFF
jgi:hypothetical protein